MHTKNQSKKTLSSPPYLTDCPVCGSHFRSFGEEVQHAYLHLPADYRLDWEDI